MTPARPSQCETCIFRTDGRQVRLRPGRFAEIELYLLDGRTHLCHHGNNLACRGGREFQLTIWARLGIIPEPTDAALDAAMRAKGVEP